ncbi:Surfeit protein isoform 1 [Operophtera brumata]|uniref:SURF1-like protein n=1 Tax=Operophtera brumata TaxID=104452 RepID=A0A0L7LES0_OPEBR|nr:Surfeit protein isoform 1 [Operophtera brumata]
MSILRSLCKIPRYLAVYNNSSKSLLQSTVRWNTSAANAFKAHRAQAKAKKEPVEVFKWILLVSFTELEKMEYKPVKVRGKFVHEKELLIGPRALIDETSGMSRVGSLVSDPKKNQGWLVVTPFMLADTGEVILVNRGWIHQSMKPKEKREASLIDREVELVGVVRLTEKRAPFMPKNHPEKGSWFYRDLQQMSSYIGCQPVWLDARGIPDPPEGWPIPNQTRVTIRNEHLSYVITWYSLSFFTALMWHRYFIRKLALL